MIKKTILLTPVILLLLTLTLSAAPISADTQNDTATPATPATTTTPGDIIQFGNITWRVLDTRTGGILLISEYSLGLRAYNGTSVDITYENSDIRRYLNSEFLSEYFSPGEITKIITTRVTNPGSSVYDKVFLLSIDEVIKYFGDNSENRIAHQGYNIDQGWRVLRSGEAGWWWLRSPGRRPADAASIGADGRINAAGFSVTAIGGIRPCIWLSPDTPVTFIPPEEASPPAPAHPYAETQPSAKTAYITIDDGPSRGITDRMLDTLKKYNAKATFFTIPKNGADDLFMRIINEGHAIGSHSYSHDLKSLYTPGTRFFRDDIQKAHNFYQNRFGYTVKVFRFPGGSGGRSAQVLKPRQDFLASMGYRWFDWTSSFADTSSSYAARDPNVLAANGLSKADGRNRVIILLHDTPDKHASAEALDMLIAELINRSYTFDTLENY